VTMVITDDGTTTCVDFAYRIKTKYSKAEIFLLKFYLFVGIPHHYHTL
jgi:hypothetical protein